MTGECSTPFGINGRNSSLDRNGIATPLLGAQRLSASTEGTRPASDLRCGTLFSAQRLSASTEGTHVQPLDTGTRWPVLNAFRHQRKELTVRRVRLHDRAVTCSTPFGINGRNTRPATVAACSAAQRAQRLSASTEGTPRPSGDLSSLARVLNAFRHQRKEHQAYDHDHDHVYGSAQRLSASTEGTRRSCRGHDSERVAVLNAFRHQRKEHSRARL